MRVRVYHSFYGCDTGCCGHTVEIDMPNGTTLERFKFEHPDSLDCRKFAQDLVYEVLEEEAPFCLKTIDWDSIEFDEVSDQ